jgi:Lipase (class 3)
VYTFGQPKLGNDAFRKSFNEKVAPVYQLVNHRDIVPRAIWWYNKLETTKYIKGRETPIIDLLKATSMEDGLNRAILDAKLKEAQAVKVRNAVARLDALFVSLSSKEIPQLPVSRSIGATGVELSDVGPEPDLTEAQFKELQEELKKMEEEMAFAQISGLFEPFSDHSMSEYIKYLKQLIKK